MRSDGARAIVRVGGRDVAVLERTVHGSTTTYLPEVIDAGGPAICFAMPVRSVPYETHGDNLPPFFAGLLPEGLRLTTLVRIAKTSPSDMFTLLMLVGDETVGDVSVHSDAYRDRGAVKIRVTGRTKFADLRSSLGQAASHSESGIAGVISKVSSSRLTAPLVGMGRKKRYIIKLTDPTLPDLATNEHAVMSIAKHCGFPVALTKVLTDRAGESALLVERFDRVWKAAGEFSQVHVEDACQFLDRYPSDKYSGTGGISLSDVAKGLMDFATSGRLEVLRLLERYCFTYLVGDSDFHAKNISLWVNPRSGLVELSPMYDSVCSLPYKGTVQRCALSMDGRDDEFKKKTFVDFGARYGLAREAVSASVDRVAACCTELIEQAFAKNEWPFAAPGVVGVLRGRARKLMRTR